MGAAAAALHGPLQAGHVSPRSARLLSAVRPMWGRLGAMRVGLAGVLWKVMGLLGIVSELLMV